MAEVLAARGCKVWTGGTDSHMLMLDLAGHSLDGAAAEHLLEQAGMTANGIRIPGSYEEAPSGLRLGTAAITTRGMGLEEAGMIAGWVADVLDQPGSRAVVGRVRQAAEALAGDFPVYT